MARKYPIVPHTVFAGSASGAPNGVAQFGSKQTGTPDYTANIANIQSLAAWLQGWAGAVVKGKVLPLEELNAAFLEPSYQLATIFECGIPDWNAGITYSTYSIVQYSGTLYQSTADSNTGNTPGSSSQWKYFNPGATKGENLFRNAGLSVLQRGSVGTVTAGTSAYGPDGWVLSPVGANMSWHVYSGAVLAYTNAPSSLELDATSGMTDFELSQYIESTIMQTIAGNTFLTFQVTVHNSLAIPITPTLTVNLPTALDNYTGIVTLVSGVSLQTVGAGTTQTLAYTFQLTDVHYLSGMQVILDFGTALNGSSGKVFLNSFDISATPFFSTVGLQSTPPLPQIRPVGIEMASCLRYFQMFLPSGGGIGLAMGWADSSTTAKFLFPLSAPMRTSTPTLGYSALSDFAIGTGSAVYAHPLTVLTTSTGTAPSVVQVNATVGSGLTTGAAFLDVYGGTSPFISFSCEI